MKIQFPWSKKKEKEEIKEIDFAKELPKPPIPKAPKYKNTEENKMPEKDEKTEEKIEDKPTVQEPEKLPEPEVKNELEEEIMDTLNTEAPDITSAKVFQLEATVQDATTARQLMEALTAVEKRFGSKITIDSMGFEKKKGEDK